MSRSLSYKLRRPFAKFIFSIIEFINIFKQEYYYLEVKPAKYMDNQYYRIHRNNIKKYIEIFNLFDFKYKKISSELYYNKTNYVI